jgi:hypothetical protein
MLMARARWAVKMKEVENHPRFQAFHGTSMILMIFIVGQVEVACSTSYEL